MLLGVIDHALRHNVLGAILGLSSPITKHEEMGRVLLCGMPRRQG